MNCRQARNIINLLLDGEYPVHADDARQHLASCASCRKWHESMERAVCVAETAPVGLIAPDLSASIMARLPERHPASLRAPRRTWTWKRGLGWAAAAWVAGLVVLATTWFAVGGWLSGQDPSGSIILGYDLTRAVMSVARGLVGALGALTGVLRDALPGVAPYALTCGLIFLVLDTALLCTGIFIWRTRRRVPGAMCIFV